MKSVLRLLGESVRWSAEEEDGSDGYRAVFAHPGVIFVPLPTDRAVLLTTDEAARRFGVKPGTIRQWVRRGHLQPAGRLPAGGSSVYRLDDLARADEATRRKAGRPSQAERARQRLRAA